MSDKKKAPLTDVQGRPVVVEQGFAVADPRYVNALPWIERERLGWEKFQEHCAKEGLPAPTPLQWWETFKLTDSELANLLALQQTQIGDMCELDDYFVVRKLGNKPRVCWLEDDGTLNAMSMGDFKNAYQEMTVEIGYDDNGIPQFMEMAKAWLKRRETRRYKTAKFMPGKYWGWPSDVFQLWPGWPSGLIRERDTKPLLVGDVPEPEDEFDGSEQPKEASRFLNHMLDSMCGGDEEVYMYLLGWMAEALIVTGRSQVAVALTGPSGSGKGTFVELFGSFFGSHYVAVGSKHELVGNFNRQFMTAQLIGADEVGFAANDEDTARLRGLVTERTINIEFKGIDRVSIKKEFRLILTGNEEHIVSALKDDRRYLVLRVDSGADNHNELGYFQPMRDQWEAGGQVALFRWLTGRYWRARLASNVWHVTDRPVTQTLITQKEASLDSVEKLIHHMLAQGEVPHKLVVEDGQVFASNGAMAKENRLEFSDSTRLGILLGKIAGRESVRRSIIPYGQVRGFFLDDLATSRKRWEEHLGWQVAWPIAPEAWFTVDEGSPEPGDSPEEPPEPDLIDDIPF